MLADQRLIVREILKAIGISHGLVISILNELFSMTKLPARSEPRWLTIDNKTYRVTIAKDCLALFNRNLDRCSWSFIIIDEIWIHTIVHRCDDYRRIASSSAIFFRLRFISKLTTY